MQLNWLYTTLLSVALFAAQASAQGPYSSSSSPSVYTPPSSTPYPPPPDYTAYTPSTVTVTSVSITTLSSITTTTTTTTSFETVYSQSPYGYDSSYIPPIKKKTGLIIGLVVGLCGLALLLLIALLLRRRSKKNKVVDYGKGSKTYGEPATTPATGY